MSQIMEKTLASLPKLLTQSLIGNKSTKPTGPQQPSQDVQNFMKYVHRARSKSHEAAIVNAELSNIQQKLKQTDLTTSTGIVRNSFTKAIFCHLIGYDVSFVAIYAVNLAQQGRGFDKRLGYLLSCLLLHPHHEMVMLMMATLLRDLKSTNMGDNCLALLVAGELVGEENIPSILPEVLRKLRHSHELVREKALHCFRAFYQCAPPLLQPSLPQLNTCLSSRDPGILMATTNIFLILTAENPVKYVGLRSSFLHILHQINHRGFGSNYYYHMVPLPWLQINILKILGNLGAVDSQLSEAATPLLKTLIERTKVTEPISLAVLVESVATATKVSTDEQLLHLCSRCIGKLLSADAGNAMRYHGLGLLISLSRVKSTYAAQHQMAVVECLSDEDPAIQVRTTQLLHAMANRANVKAICTKLFEQINKTNDKVFVNDVLQMISDLAERLTVDIDWYLETYLSILELNLNSQLRDVFIDSVLSRMEKVSRKTEPIPEDSLNNLVSVLLQVLNKQNSVQPLVMLSLQLFGVLAPVLESYLPVDLFLTSTKNLFLSPSMSASQQKKGALIKPPVQHSYKGFDQNQLDELTDLQCSCLDTTAKLVLSGCLEVERVGEWLEKHNFKSLIRNPTVHCSLSELEELIQHPEDLPMRSKIMFHPQKAEIDMSLSFLDQLVVQNLLQGQETFKPKYVKLAEMTANIPVSVPNLENQSEAQIFSEQNVLEASKLDASKASSSGSSKMSKSFHRIRNKWRDDDGDDEQFLIVDADGDEDMHHQEEKRRKEGVAKELFAGLDIVEHSELLDFPSTNENNQNNKKGRSMWDDDEDADNGESQSRLGSLSLHPFGVPKKTKTNNQSQWQEDDIENDNFTYGLDDNFGQGFFSMKSEKDESPSGFVSPPSGQYDMEFNSQCFGMSGSNFSPMVSSYPGAHHSHVDNMSPTGHRAVAPSIYSDHFSDFDPGTPLGDIASRMTSSSNVSMSTIDALTDSDPESSPA